MAGAMHAAIGGMITRVKIAAAIVSGRTLVQLTGLDEDAHDNIELLLPPGYVARPLPGSDAIEIWIGGRASHKVVLGGDNTADAVLDLQLGEGGLSRGGQRIILRLMRTEIVSPLLQWSPAVGAELERLVQEKFLALYNAHKHTDPQGGTTGVPIVPMDHTHLTGGS